MAAVNWDGTEKVMNTRAVTLSIYLMMSYKIYVVREQQRPQLKKTECLHFQEFQPFS